MYNPAIVDDANNKWLESELQHVKFKYKRLIDRLIKTSNLIEWKASGSINQSCRNWKDAKGAYRLFSNEKVEVREIYSSHYKETYNRIKDQSFILAVQDTTYLDYDSHIKTKDLGSISKAYTKHKMGLIVHSSLAVTVDGMPLGLTSQQCWARPIREEKSVEKSRRKYVTKIEDKESYKWISALKQTIKNVPNIKIITIGDREADIFEFLWEVEALGTLFVIRNRHDRKLICPEVGKTKVQSNIKKSLIKQEIILQVPKKGSHRAATIEVKYSTGFIPIRPASIYGSSSKHKISDNIMVYVISAKEINPPEGVEAIDWTLLTNVPVNNMDDAVERISWYKLRWKIEEYFRILKSGCKIENSRLSTQARLKRLIAIAL
jgi:hypothetical protein